MAGTLKGARSMSFLSPRRRKTTSNIKVNGQVAGEAPPLLPSLGSPRAERPPAAHRPVSQPVVPSVNGVGVDVGVGVGGGDENLFYAYARKGDDLKSRYLLTFASASVANEWWLHLQTNFPDASRPGPQLFSFKTEDLLSKAWRHPSFAHLKSKWMYISFSDAPDAGLGGAALGIIPVQDAEGNLLGGGAPASPETAAVREVRDVKMEVGKLEAHFEKMMEKVAELAEVKHQRTRSASDVVSFKVDSLDDGRSSSARDSIDMGVLSGHFVRMNDLLSKNTAHVEEMTRKHQGNEEKLRQAVESLDKRQRQGGALDMDKLAAHLDRIQSLMESSAMERKDSAREVAQMQSQPLQVDFSPLTERLEKVQEAVEQNSALIRALLDEGDTSKPTTPFWGKDQPMQPDLTPLVQHLEKIHSAVEQQGGYMKALVGYASGENQPDGEVTGVQPAAGLAPLGENLEMIYNAIEEGNTLARQSKGVDLGSLETHLTALREHSEQNNTHMEELIESQNSTREAVWANGGEIDFTPLAELLDAIRDSTDSNAEVVKQLLSEQKATRQEATVDFTPLTDHLQAVRDATERNSAQMQTMLESQQSSAAKAPVSPDIDFTPLTDRLNRIHSVLQKQSHSSTPPPGTGDSKFVMNALTSHLSKIQSITEANAKAVSNLHSKTSSVSDKMHISVAETSDSVRALVQRNEENEARIEAQNSQMRELMSGQREMVEVMRQLTKSIVAQNKGACDHVVVPPPRKMGRKVVGFVYDAKEGTP